MIGYLFTKEELNIGELSKSKSSIDSLLNRTKVSVEEMLFGDASLGAMFEKSGYKAVPSPRYYLVIIFSCCQARVPGYTKLSHPPGIIL